jgi:carbon-monoxide dehydrogenase catalytic subunit
VISLVCSAGGASANLGTLKKNAVNIAVHVQSGAFGDDVAGAYPEAEAKLAGAGRASTLVICCTGNEVMMRHGIPMATSSVSQSWQSYRRWMPW